MVSLNDTKEENEIFYVTLLNPLDARMILFLEHNPGSTWSQLRRHFVDGKTCSYDTFVKHLKQLRSSRRIYKKLVKDRVGYYAGKNALLS